MPSYTLDELIKRMEPQAQRDKSLINRCVAGLGLYAAQIAQGNSSSSKVDEMRKLIENLIGYWGLDDSDHAPPLDDYLQAFDEQIHAAKSGAEIKGGTYNRQIDTIYGLHRYGEDMAVSQGDTAMSEILDVCDLMKEIALHWDFEPYSAVNDLADQLRAEVRDMLEAIPLPGQPVSGEQTHYKISQAILFNNDRGFALAHNPNAPAPFVTWQFTNEEGNWSYYWGHYMSTEERARIDYISRATDYLESYKVTEIPIPTATAEISTEQNYNMIDGVRNNEAPAERFPVEVRSEGQPFVTVTFSEHNQLRSIDKMPLYLADKLFAEADAKLGADDAPYYKTDFHIEYIRDGEADFYTGYYDVGDGDGSLIDHIQAYAEYNRRDESYYQQYLADKGEGEQETANARLDNILSEIVPLFRMHCHLSEIEAAALSELLCIHDDRAHGERAESDAARIGHLESVLGYATTARDALCKTGLVDLPDEPKPYAEVVDGAASVPVSGEQASVLNQIKTSRQAPKPPVKHGAERNKKTHGPEL